MSLKYQRVKKEDESLWPPVRWVLRLFSSITFGVALLVVVCIYGVLGTVPVGPLPTWVALALIYTGCFSLPTVIGGIAAWRWAKPLRPGPAVGVWIACVGIGAAAGTALAIFVGMQLAGWRLWPEFFREYQTVQIYKLPAFEMTELQFYAWWPMRLVLGLFVATMVISTIRRIEFNFLNIGVLTVHTGIVTLAVGAAIYGLLKVEGDTMLMDPSIDDRPVSYFYDYQYAALHLKAPSGAMIDYALPEMPRWNDHMDGSYEARLHERAGFGEIFGSNLRVTIAGALPYAVPEQVLRDDPDAGSNPAVIGRFFVTDASGAIVEDAAADFRLVADDGPTEAKRWRGPGVDALYLGKADEGWLEMLATPFEGERALVVSVPEAGYEAVHVVEVGATVELGETGYRVTVEEFMARYPFPVLTAGYRGAQPNVAVVRIEGPDDFAVLRWAMHPYPQLTQDFPIDPETGEKKISEQSGRPIRTDADERIRVTYLDASKQYAYLHDGESGLRLLRRDAGGAVAEMPVAVGERVRLTNIDGGGATALVIDERLANAVWERTAKPVPKRLRKSDEEGRYLHAMIPVDVALVDDEGQTVWERREWLRFMEYVERPQADRRPVTLNVPGYGQLEMAFGRLRHELPFAMTLVDFEMVPYPGSELAKDFRSQLRILQPRADGRVDVSEGVSRLNNPLVVQGYKLSQAGWDPQAQQFTIIGVGNNPGIVIVAIGGVLMSVGIPWAFYVKPALLKRRKRKLREQQEKKKDTSESTERSEPDASVEEELEAVSV